MASAATTISACLETLEDSKFTNMSTGFVDLNKKLKAKDCNVTSAEVLRILAAYERCIKDDVQGIPHALTAVLSLLRNAKVVETMPVQDLLPSVLAVLHTILCMFNKTENLRCLAMEVFLSYPSVVLSAMVRHNCHEIIEIFKMFKPSNILQPVDKSSYYILKGLLSKLPPEDKQQLAEEGISVWFGSLLPFVMDMCRCRPITEEHLGYIECLETLTDVLVNVDYFHHPKWQKEILKNICDQEKYPTLIKEQLTNMTNTWHRLWIVLVKLMKTRITVNGPYGTPIQSMLGVVELAFKIERQKVNAFRCWDNLIDSLSKDTNPNCLPRYLKLLMIPLKLSNTKSEETTLAKFNTWWNLISKFNCKLDKFTGDILVAFIRFVFGKKDDKCLIVDGVGMKYDSIRVLCLQAYVQIVGHDNKCSCCPDIPKLSEKMLTIKLLLKHWEDWLCALNCAILMTHRKVESDKPTNEPMQVSCIWRALIKLVSELPDNNVKIDMFYGLFKVLKTMLEAVDNATAEILFHLTLVLTEDSQRLKSLIFPNKGYDQTLRQIITIISHPKMQEMYVRYNTDKIVKVLKPLTDLVMESSLIDWMLDNLTDSVISLKIWAVLANSLIESTKEISPMIMYKMLSWPVKLNIQEHLVNPTILRDKDIAMLWHTLYGANAANLTETGFDASISKLIHAEEMQENPPEYFKVVIALNFLKNKLSSEEDVGVFSKPLENYTSVMRDYRLYEPAIPLLVDIIIIMIKKVCPPHNINVQLALVAINCVKNFLPTVTTEIKSQDDKAHTIAELLSKILEAVEPMYEIPNYSHICCELVQALTEEAEHLNRDSTLFKFILSGMNTLKQKALNKTLQIQKTVLSEIDVSIETLTKQLNKIVSDTTTDTGKTIKQFLSPKNAMKSKKKASIVKTFVENGEKYVEVKSNWKFNPRKLTENQKEKLQRKREDIPALYQDLSQSQEEFKLRSWKTDSQDATTSSNSKSSTLKGSNNEDATNILKNIQSSHVVPNIMKNIVSEKHNTFNSSATNSEHELQIDKSKKVESVTPKTTKSPRMALKDRVFRNVKNLIEKSSPNNDTNNVIVADCQLDNAPKAPTPMEQTNNTDLIKSAQSPICSDRPSRMKRKPKKFDDVQLFGLKKRRHSQTDSLSTENQIGISNGRQKRQSQDDISNDANKNDLGIENNYSLDVANISDCKITEETELNQDVHDRSAIIKVLTQNNDREMDVQIETNVDNDHSKIKKQYTEKTDSSHNCLNVNDSHNKQKHDVGEDIAANNDSQQLQNIRDSLHAQMEQTLHGNLIKVSENKLNVKNSNQLNSGAENNNKEIEPSRTPIRKVKETSQKSTTKKTKSYKSRIEKELAIDMVEGHPFLKIQSEKRLTRNKLLESENSGKRKSVLEKPVKIKTPSKTSPKESKKVEEEKPTSSCTSSSLTVEKTQEKHTLLEDAPNSEDVIESSQDSTFTTISVKSTKRTPQRVPIVSVEEIKDITCKITLTQELLQDSECEVLCVEDKTANQDSRDDIELPQNKTAEIDKNRSVLTENMNMDVIIIEDDIEPPITLSSEKCVGLETQELAEADTQPNDPADFATFEPTKISEHIEIPNTAMDVTEAISPNKFSSVTTDTQKDVTEIIVEQIEASPSEAETDVCSPFKDDTQRKQDFLNNTSEISPIKVQSPDKNKSSPEKEEETSSDFLVVKLSSPVHSNGEPYHSGSPEFFTEDKISPDKRDQSPPRAGVNTSSGSPSSSLSLKKNRPQTMRAGGRAAHMLGLCVPDSLNSIKHLERTEPEEPKKISTSTPARRNLRVLYNAVNDNSDDSDKMSEEEEQGNFLKLKKALPSVDSSPSVPILKRKFDLVDDNTLSPAGKRKRVSFHDPPVSTTVSVHKYIEPGNKSPSSAPKRLERQMIRSLTKPPKRLDTVFKLDTVLSKAVESFKDQTDSLSNDTNTSLDVTPAVEVINTSELNDKDPICPALVNCNDCIENIALELSSPAMKELLVKELDGKVATVGDLAKMTELEVNRLCIKAPKVLVAKKVLAGYVPKNDVSPDVNIPEVVEIETAISTEIDEEMTESEPNTGTIETQTDEASKSNVMIQTDTNILKFVSTQTCSVSTKNRCIQTMESGFKTTSEVISSCLSERPDFMHTLRDALSTDTVVDMLANKTADSDLTPILIKLMDRRSQYMPGDESKTMELSYLNEILCQRFSSRDLFLFFSKLFQSLYDKHT